MDTEHPEALIPTVQKLEDIMIVVAGGRSLGWAAVLPGWGFFGGNPVTRRIEG